MNHRTELGIKNFEEPSCDDGVTACQAVVKTRLANATEQTGTMRNSGKRVRQFSGRVTFEIEFPYEGGTFTSEITDYFYGGWLENSIFISTDRLGTTPYEANEYLSARHDNGRYLSMGIKDTNPVTGVYRGESVNEFGDWGTFELNYTSGATGGQLDMTLDNTYTWTNVAVDNEGYFDNDIRRRDRVVGGNKLEGRFYQGGEVGGVYSYREGQNGDYDSFRYGSFGGKLVPASP